MPDQSPASTLNSPHTVAAPAPALAPRSQQLTAIVGLVIGVVVFFILGFNHVLPPGRVNWLLRASVQNPYYDPSTEYLGWDFFRRSPWTMPLGLNRNYGMEFGGSIVYSDSIPLLAILFKPFSHFMGRDFQYIGIWILICFALQGMFGALLGSLITRRIELKAIIATFFALSPILLERGWDEYPLMGHWLILWALYLYFIPRTTRILWAWMLIALLAATTSFYFLPIILVIWGADAVKTSFLQWRRIGWLILEGGGILATALGAMWLAGYFAISVNDAGTNNFGQYALNVLGPIDSWGRSLFMTAQQHGPHWLGEGYAYFGFGMILLATMAAFELLRAPTPRRQWLFVLPLLLVLVALTIFAMSNEVAIGSHELIYPYIFLRFGRMFRASARMFWPAYYAAWLATFYLTTRGLKYWVALLLLGATLTVQIVDYTAEYASIQRRFRTLDAWHTPLKSAFWNDAVQKYRRIIVVPSGEAFPYVPIAYLAVNHNLPTNGVYVSRYPSGAVIGPISDSRLNALRANQPDPQTLYIIPDADRYADLANRLGKIHGVGVIDGYHVIAPLWFDDHTSADSEGLIPGAGD